MIIKQCYCKISNVFGFMVFKTLLFLALLLFCMQYFGANIFYFWGSGLGARPRPLNFIDLQGWYAEFLLKIILQFLLGKIAARLIFKIKLKSLHIGPEVNTVNTRCRTSHR